MSYGIRLIRNISIISHVNHGKSTLADRFLEMTGTVAKEKIQPQFLDSMDLERERGITIKMHPVRMLCEHAQNQKGPYGEQAAKIKNQNEGNDIYILNLIDTPGHIDFSYEISRALACVEGAIILVDATKGIQAQTVFNLDLAKNQGLKILAAVNKIDAADEEQIKETRTEIANAVGVPEQEIFLISAKTGQGVRSLLQAVISQIPAPGTGEGQVRDRSLEVVVPAVPGQRQGSAWVYPGTTLAPGTGLKALVFDSKYDDYSGVVAFIRVFEGEIKKGDKIIFMASNTETEVKEAGIFIPGLKPCDSLSVGEIGYIKTGIKEPGRVRAGDTITKLKIKNEKLKINNTCEIKPLPGYKKPQPVLYLSVYPENPDEFENLKDGLQKIRLSDPSLDFELESKTVLGKGVRVGFLGPLQAEIILRRLKNEYGLNLISTAPQVVFKAILKNGKEIEVSSPDRWPDPSEIKETFEPYAVLEIIVPSHYFNAVFKILQDYKIVLQNSRNLTERKFLLSCRGPLREIVSGRFYEEIKSRTQGYGSFSFLPSGFEKNEFVKLNILIAGKIEEPLSSIVPEKEAYQHGKRTLEKLAKVLPAQQFDLALQAAVGGRIIARSTIRAKRKDVTAPLYGGDVTRKKKLLAIQKRGKKKLKDRAEVRIPSQIYLEVIRS